MDVESAVLSVPSAMNPGLRRKRSHSIQSDPANEASLFDERYAYAKWVHVCF